tara:strand:- start:1722 stop:2030 length:309 start_codon:yes stop_codon:yes gene_type:complete
MITIKHKATSEIKECTELEHFMMMDSDDWEVIQEPKRARNAKGQLKADDPKTKKNEAYVDGVGPKPTKKSSAVAIKKYLDAKGIEYNTTHKTKAQLLALIDA